MAIAGRDAPALAQLDKHRLMVARRRRGVDLRSAQARAQIAGREDEVACERVGPLGAVVDAERRRLALARVQELPRVDKGRRARIDAAKFCQVSPDSRRSAETTAKAASWAC